MGCQDRIGILAGCYELSTVIQLELKEMEKKMKQNEREEESQ